MMRVQNRFFSNRIQNQQGFSLLELMTVMSILLVMSSIALPNVIEWRQNAKLKTATRTLMTDLSMARITAIKSYNPSGAGVTALFTADGYRIFIDTNKNNAVDTGEDVLKNRHYPKGVIMRATTFSNNRTNFSRNGAVVPAGSVILDRGIGTAMRVVVSSVGRIRVEEV